MARSEQRNAAANEPPRTAPPGGPGPAAADTVATRSAIRRWWLIAGAALAIAVAGGLLWVRQAERARLRAALPASPEMAGRPAALGTALRAAKAKALSPRSSLEGIADLARLYHANGFNAEAATCWQILRTKLPHDAKWTYYLADLRRTEGDDRGMVSLLEQTVALAPDYTPAWLRLAEWEFKTGRMEEAERDYRRRLALLPADPYARLGVARIALQRDRRKEGEQMLEAILHAVPGFSAAHNLYAEILAAAGDADGAKQQRWLGHLAGRFREADDPWLEELQAWCYDPSRLAVLASIEDITNHGDRGVALLQRAIKLAPADGRSYAELGKIYLNLGDPAKARVVLEQGLQASDAPSALYVTLSQAFGALHQPSEALRVAEQGLEKTPDAGELQNVRGIALQAAGRIAEAVEAYRRATELAPNTCEGHFNLGSALLQLGRKEEAYASLQRALTLQPTYWKALVVLGESELAEARLEPAAQYLRPLFEFYPGLPVARRLMVRWYLLSGVAAARGNQPAEAERDLRAGLAIDPEAADVHGRLGLLFAQQGRLPGAVEQLEAYHRLQPTEPIASLSLGQVYADLGRTEDARRVLSQGAEQARATGAAAIAAHCEELLARLPK